MKRIALMVLVLSLALAGSACAAKRPPGPDGKPMPTPEEQARDMSLEIRSETGLSDAMMRELHHVILDFCEQWDAFLAEHRPEPKNRPKDRPDGDRENMEREHKRLVREALDRLHPLLHPEDMDVVRHVLEEHGKPPADGGPAGGPGDGHGGGPGGHSSGPPARP